MSLTALKVKTKFGNGFYKLKLLLIIKLKIMDQMLASIMIFAGNFAPRGWAFCDGQLLAINQYTALFSLFGTTYGGDGRTTFGLPDLRGRVAIGPRHGPGLSNYSLGQRGGVQGVNLNVLEMPSHNHSAAITTAAAAVGIPASSANATTADPSTTTVLAKGLDVNDEAVSIYSTTAEDTTLKPFTAPVSGNVALGLTGGSQAHENRQPFLAINYIIATEGFYPSRS